MRNDAIAYAGLANALVLADHAEEGEESIRTAMRLDPHYLPSYLITLGAAQFGREQYEAAAKTFERAVKRNPENELPLIYLASSYGHLGRIGDADDAIEAVNDRRGRLGLGDISLENKSFSSFSPFEGEIDFDRIGGTRAKERVRAGLSDVPALTWQYRITVLEAREAGETRWEIDGVTKIDIDTAKSLYDHGAVFIDSSSSDVWNKRHVLGAIHMRSGWSDDPAWLKFSKATLIEVADKTEELVLYCQDSGCDGSPYEAAKAANWGFQKVYRFRGGALAWEKAGYPVETE